MKKEGVEVSITGNSTNPTRFQHLVAGTYKKWAMENGKKYFSVASGGGTGRTLHPGQRGRRPRFLRPDRLHGPYARRRPVRRLFLRARPRGNDGPHRHGQQPHGGRHRGLRRGCQPGVSVPAKYSTKGSGRPARGGRCFMFGELYYQVQHFRGTKRSPYRTLVE